MTQTRTSGKQPVIAIVPGAWHTPAHFTPFCQCLKQQGYESVVRQLPSVGSEHPEQQDVAADVAFIREQVLEPLLQAGQDIVLLSHSYGGIPGGASATGLSKQERQAAGKPGGVAGLIFLSAALAKEGQTMAEADGRAAPDWVIFKVGLLLTARPQVYVRALMLCAW